MLLLKQIELHNICQHVAVKQKLRPGLIGVLGRCGSGKSNFLGAVKATLTNDFSFGGTDKQKKINRKAGEHAQSYVSAIWDYDGTELSIRRDLRPSRSRLLVTGAETPLTKQSEIAVLLSKTLGVSSRVIDDHVFVDQWAVRDLLLSRKTDRINAFAYLCGADRIEALWSLLGTQLSSERSTLGEMLLHDLTSKSRDLAQRKQQLSQYADELQQLLPKVLSTEQLTQLKQTLQQHKQGESYNNQLSAAVEKQCQLQALLRQQQQQIAELQQEHDYLQVEEEQLAAAEQQLRTYQQRKLRWERRQAAEEKLRKLQQVRKPPQALSAEQCAQLLQQVRQLETEVADAQQALRLFEQTGSMRCPTCGTPTSKLEKHLQRLRESAAKSAELGRLQQQLTDETDRRQLLLQYEQREARHKAEYDSLQQLVQELSDAEQPAKIGKLDEVQLSELRGRLQRTKKSLVATQTGVDKTAGRLEELQELISGLRHKLKSSTMLTTDKLRRTNELLSQHESAAGRAAYLTSLCQLKQQELQQAQAEYRKAKSDNARRQELHSWSTRLEEYRAVLHRENFPKLYMQAVFEEVVNEVNQHLAEFEADFRVAAGDDLALLVVNQDGSQEPAAAKSGGESVVIAIAYRLAINTRFAGELGIMVLDEPTAGLDEHYLDNLADVLVRVNESAKKRRQQIIIVTHDQRLERVFNQLIKFG